MSPLILRLLKRYQWAGPFYGSHHTYVGSSYLGVVPMKVIRNTQRYGGRPSIFYQ